MIKAGSKGVQTIQCLERAVDILTEVGRAGEMGISQLAAHLALAVPTVSNIVRTLAWRNLLINTGGRYRLGPALAALSTGCDVPSLLEQLVPPCLERIGERTGESAVAVTLSGVRAMRIGWCPARDELTTQIPDHVLDAPLTLATGQLLAAMQPRERWQAIVDNHLAACGKAATARNRRPYTKLFEQIVEAGENLQPPGHTVDSRNARLAVPVHDASATVVAALGASCPKARASARHFAEMTAACRQEAAYLSNRLGYAAPAEVAAHP